MVPVGRRVDRMARDKFSSVANFGRRAVLPLSVLLASAFILSFGVLFNIAWDLDAETEAHSESFIQASWTRRVEDHARMLEDYASWGGAYSNLHVTHNRRWAYDEQNIGSTLYDRFGYDFVFVIDGEGRTTYAVVEGKLSEASAGDILKGDLAGMLAKARNVPANSTVVMPATLHVGSDPVLAAFGAISTGPDTTVAPIEGTPSVLIFGQQMTPDVVRKLGEAVFVDGLRVSEHTPKPASHGSLLIPVENARPIGLFWNQEKPGSVLLRNMLPWLLAAATALAILVALTFRNAARSVALLQSNAEDLKKAHDEAHHQATHDIITGLPNRYMLKATLEEEFRAGAVDVSLLYVDLDRFKAINDELGHPAGDRVLRVIAERLCAAVGDGGLVARVGGDEFVILLRNFRSRIEPLCQALLEVGAAEIDTGNGFVDVGLSIGVALAPDHACEPDELIRVADIALYEAKQSGRRRYRVFSAELDERIQARSVLEAEFNRALASNEFTLWYQPRLDARSLELRSVEALVRWQHPARGLVSPADFIPFAEQTGLIIPLGSWILREACVAAAGWPEFGVSVNVSPVQFRAVDFVVTVKEALSLSGLPAGRLELEITEGVLLEDVDRARRILMDLKALGVRLSMDDFGTGYSSLGYLKSFTFDAIKIDRQFIADLQPHGQSRAIVQAILGLGRALGLTVTAEGVETNEQLILLRMDRCDEIQGHLLARPMPHRDIVRIYCDKTMEIGAAAG